VIIGNDFGDPKKKRLSATSAMDFFVKDGPKVIRSGCKSKCEITRL
jgi:hypothetical protein